MFSNSTLEPNRIRSVQSGSVMLEFALVVAGIVFGTLLFVDVAGGLTEYLRLSMVVSEGVKAAARTPGLEDGQFADIDVDPGILNACESLSQGTSPCNQFEVHRKVRFLIINTTERLDLANTVIRSEFLRVAGGTQVDLVRVRVSSSYQGFWLFGIPIELVREGPYLLE